MAPATRRQYPVEPGAPDTRCGGADLESANFLRDLADEELAQAQQDAWIRRKVAAARADARPGMTTQAVRASLQSRLERWRDGARSRGTRY